ncbi:hypothetical protein DL98DRAFT_522833 [Cadophora sp. DSE1049]|nr:hypothetical protein DL98DRAFT_522833 [Cadophora sp. DSE1049]
MQRRAECHDHDPKKKRRKSMFQDAAVTMSPHHHTPRGGRNKSASRKPPHLCPTSAHPHPLPALSEASIAQSSQYNATQQQPQHSFPSNGNTHANPLPVK